MWWDLPSELDIGLLHLLKADYTELIEVDAKKRLSGVTELSLLGDWVMEIVDMQVLFEQTLLSHLRML